MTLREHFDAIEHKLDRLLDLVEHRPKFDSLDEVTRETEQLLAEIEEHLPARGHRHRASPDISARPSTPPPPIRLLVEEAGTRLWRTVEGRCVLGSAGADGELAVIGRWTKTAGPRIDFYVIQAVSGKFVVYQRPADSSVGTIQIADDLAALATLLPADLYQEARQRALPGGRSRVPGYPELPLEGV
jgi:hypothetical protein